MNPGRLRHCNGYESQCHCRKAGRRDKARSRSQDIGWNVLVGPTSGAFLRKEKDEASPPNCFGRLVEFTSIPRLRRLEVFYFRLRTGLSTKTSPRRLARAKLKDQQLKKIILGLAAASVVFVSHAQTIALDDIQFWAGSGTNRAALVVEWSTPESYGISTVPAPSASKSLVWGYRFNGTASGTEMFKAILAADPMLFAVADLTYGTYIEGLGYRLSGSGVSAIADATHTNSLAGRYLTNATVNIDSAAPLLPGDMYWGGYFGPNWEMWIEAGGAGGFANSPDRGPNAYWTPDDPEAPYSGLHGQWELSFLGLDGLELTNGSWIGFSVAAGEYEGSTAAPYNTHKHAPSMPDTAITAPPVLNLNGAWDNSGLWQCAFTGRTNWLYALERSTNLVNWTAVISDSPGVDGTKLLSDTNSTTAQAFYRIRAERP